AQIGAVDLAVDAQLAHPASDQLRVLTAKVEDQNLFSVDVHHRSRLSHTETTLWLKNSPWSCKRGGQACLIGLTWRAVSAAPLSVTHALLDALVRRARRTSAQLDVARLTPPRYSNQPGRRLRGKAALLDAVVRRLLGDDHV